MTTLDSHQLSALADFLNGLTELTNETGIALSTLTGRPMVEVNDQHVTVDVTSDQAGNVSYAVDMERS